MSRTRSNSPAPFGRKKLYPSSPSYSSSSFGNGRIVPRSSPASVSSHYFGNVRPAPPSRGSLGGVKVPVGFLSAEELLADEGSRSGDSISVTVRFRPLSEREYQRGDEIAWYADGERIARNEYNPASSYAYDKVFGPSTSSQVVYDVAARPVVKQAMEGINGTVFAYGVTSSGKTHTMHGDQNSPGIIPLAIKDVFSIIQDTPGMEFLLRVSYLEIYNEVINDLLDPTGQNLRVREDDQGTYVEGIKEELVLSPGHALSFIAAGEEHRHVGSNNYNLFSSRSHTIFTLMIESSAHGDEYDGVTFSQLNLIDLAGSESSKTETTGLRRKEGSYINKSLLTLGTVIGKLSEGKSSHIPYRDSKLTRLLQSSLSGHGHVSLICTITPASSNYEETHNTLKFASRAKRVEIYASRNRIIDEKSLIKKYQKEISTLKEELEHLKQGLSPGVNPEEITILRQQLEEGQVKMQYRLEEEEEAKAALMSRIQRLTKLILVSTKNIIPGNLSDVSGSQQLQSFGDNDKDSLSSSQLSNSLSNKLNDELLSSSGSVTELTHAGERAGDVKSTMSVMMSLDEVDLFVEKAKMLAGEIAFGTSALKRLREQSSHDPSVTQIQIQNLEKEILEKQTQMRTLERQIIQNNEAFVANASMVEMQDTVSNLMTQCNEKGFELELTTADNRILREQLQEKCHENKELCYKILDLEQQLDTFKREKTPSCQPCTSEEIEILKRNILSQEAENMNLNLERTNLLKEKSSMLLKNQKLSEEASYAKELASAAAVELKNLAEEVTKITLQNAIQGKELLAAQELAYSRSASLQAGSGGLRKSYDGKIESTRVRRRSNNRNSDNWNVEINDMKIELQTRKEREASLEAALVEKDFAEDEYKQKYDESKKRELALENELAGMWVLVAKMKKEVLGVSDFNSDGKLNNSIGIDLTNDFKENADENNDAANNLKQLSDGYLKPNGDHYNQNTNMEPLLVRVKAQIMEMKEKKIDYL